MLLLMAQFGPRVTIPVEDVRREYFSHFDLDTFLRRIQRGTIRLPVTRADKHRRTSRFISMVDLALYLDRQVETGRSDYQQILADAANQSRPNRRLLGVLYRT
ncbi:pyocin activator PrtN family protein [Paraburkholderia graminis]|uniref:pyocin activator PrtN family protein n=1 Tax=Paraburkholderia graminis TaxID=60548 RepID=UPI0038B984A8